MFTAQLTKQKILYMKPMQDYEICTLEYYTVLILYYKYQLKKMAES